HRRNVNAIIHINPGETGRGRTSSMTKRTAAAGLTAILLCGTAWPVQAQEDTEDAGLDQIIVTAERREQNLQDVPISATVLTGEQLAQRGVVNLNDIQQVAPSIAINTFNRS